MVVLMTGKIGATHDTFRNGFRIRNRPAPSAGGGRKTMDPIEREARKLAREAIKGKLAEQGRKIGEVDKEKLAELVETVAMNEDILKAAKNRQMSPVRRRGIPLAR